MACVQKVLGLPAHRPLVSHHQQSCWLSTSVTLMHRSWTKAVTKPHMRNLEGDALDNHLQQKALKMKEARPYYDKVSDVMRQMKIDAQKPIIKHRTPLIPDTEARKKVIAERRAIIEKNNADILNDTKERRKELKQRAKEKRENDLVTTARAKHLMKVQRQKEACAAIVKKVIEEYETTMITLENIDERLEVVLQNEVNYNYAITADGQKIHSTKPPGNLDGWKGPPPTAYLDGGILPESDEFQRVFEGKDVGSFMRRGGYFGNRKSY